MADGIQLLVTIVPSKARIVPGKLPRKAASLADHSRLDSALRSLQERGVSVVDLSEALLATTDPFMKRDTHWSTEGARAAAEAVAANVRQMRLAAPATRFELLVTGEQEVRGDLMSFVPVGELADRLGLGLESVPVAEAHIVEAPALGLFEVPTIPVTLVGTSFSADPTWGFAASLRVALELDVLDIAAEAVGPFVPMADYILGPYQEVKPQIVIWEIPERYLTLPSVEVPDAELFSSHS
jgi:alginate O-acetyltransferase complex protein AlgJ